MGSIEMGRIAEQRDIHRFALRERMRLNRAAKDSTLHCMFGIREFVNKSAASAASLDSAKFQAVIKSAASAASLCGGRASGRLDHGFLLSIFGCASAQKIDEPSSAGSPGIPGGCASS